MNAYRGSVAKLTLSAQSEKKRTQEGARVPRIIVRQADFETALRNRMPAGEGESTKFY
jgi:hypothetical protein